MPVVLQDTLSFALLMLLFACVKHYTQRSKLPAEAWILLIGISYGLIRKYGEMDAWPSFLLNPNAILFFFLPLLIYASGRHVKPARLKSQGLPIGFYALPGVLLSAMIIGLPVSLILGIPLLHGMLFGAAIGATDPIAVGAIFERFSLNKDLDILIEGESLFNDGTTVALFTLLSGVVLYGQQFAWLPALGTLSYAILLPIPIGLLAGWIAAQLLRSWAETQIFFSASMGIILALLLFALCEYGLHCSGVIAVLFAALMMSRQDKKPVQGAQESKIVLDAFWSYTSQSLNGFMFFLLGAATGQHEFNLPGIALLVGIIAMLGARAMVVYAGGLLLRLFAQAIPLSWQHIMVLGGLRGAVSAALILLIPIDYVHRDHFLCLAFFLIAFSLILQPVALGAYLTKQQNKGNTEVF